VLSAFLDVPLSPPRFALPEPFESPFLGVLDDPLDRLAQPLLELLELLTDLLAHLGAKLLDLGVDVGVRLRGLVLDARVVQRDLTHRPVGDRLVRPLVGVLVVRLHGVMPPACLVLPDVREHHVARVAAPHRPVHELAALRHLDAGARVGLLRRRERVRVLRQTDARANLRRDRREVRPDQSSAFGWPPYWPDRSSARAWGVSSITYSVFAISDLLSPAYGTMPL
jgi:hypothetical protein